MPMVKPSSDFPVSALETLCCMELALLRASSTRCPTCRRECSSACFPLCIANRQAQCNRGWQQVSTSCTLLTVDSEDSSCFSKVLRFPCSTISAGEAPYQRFLLCVVVPGDPGAEYYTLAGLNISTDLCLGSSIRLQCRLGSHSPPLALQGGAVAPAAAATKATAAMDLRAGCKQMFDCSEDPAESGTGSMTLCWHLTARDAGHRCLLCPAADAQPALHPGSRMRAIILDTETCYMVTETLNTQKVLHSPKRLHLPVQSGCPLSVVLEICCTYTPGLFKDARKRFAPAGVWHAALNPVHSRILAELYSQISEYCLILLIVLVAVT